MTSILGWTALLSMTTLDESTRREGIATIHRSAQVQAQLIDDVLDVSRMITGKLRLTIEPVDMESHPAGRARPRVIPPPRRRASGSGWTFERGLPRLGADPVRLQQVFWNLLSNALEIHAGRRPHRHPALLRDSRTWWWKCRTQAPESRPRFSPTPSTVSRSRKAARCAHHGGMGIGLSIVKQLVELHGGNVSVVSEGEGRGATFTISIPVQTTASPRTRSSVDVTEASAEAAGREAGVDLRPARAGRR